MNRRSFFRLAFGGAVAAPAAFLVGERASAYPKPSGVPSKDEIRSFGQHVEIRVSGADGDARIQRMVEAEVRRAMALRHTYTARKG
jgi:hypothetical protein